MTDGIKFPAKGIGQHRALARVERQAQGLSRAFSGSVLGRQWTHPHPVGMKAYSQVYRANPNTIMMHAVDIDQQPWIDKSSGTFASAREVEVEVLQMLADLHGLQHGWSGYLTSGGTEGNIYSLWTARNRLRGKKRTCRRLPSVVLPVSAHYSFSKALDVLGWDALSGSSDSVKWVDLDHNYRADMHEMAVVLRTLAACDDVPGIVVVGTAMTSDTGAVDHLKAIRDLIDDLHCSKPVHFHIDACMGGMFLPFAVLPPDTPSRLGILRPDSLTIDLHKMGLVAYPSSAVFVTGAAAESVSRSVPYLSSGTDLTLTGSRSGAMAFSAWAVLKALGFDGYRDIVNRTVRLAKDLRGHLEQRDWIQVVSPPWSNYATLQIRKPQSACQAEVETHNWSWVKDFSVSTTRIVRTRQELVALRRAPHAASSHVRGTTAYKLVIMPHASHDLISRFLSALDKAEKQMPIRQSSRQRA